MLLQLNKVNKSFGAVQVLHEVDFSVRAGEVTALVGDNGAGKSTLVKCVAGIHPIDGGEILFDDRSVTIHGPTDASALGIEVVYQDLALADNLDIVQNMFLGRERGRPWLLDEADMEQAARDTLASLSVRTVTSVRMPVAARRPAASARPSPSPRPSSGTRRSCCSTSRRPAGRRPDPPRCSTWSGRLAEQGLGVVLIIAQHGRRPPGLRPRRRRSTWAAWPRRCRPSDVTHGQIVELITAGRSGDLGLARPESVSI